jgi:2-polyprenyl-3-methyl-5-hydroxy-6-metoxy-1,4-benzoquinol methylase
MLAATRHRRSFTVPYGTVGAEPDVNHTDRRQTQLHDAYAADDLLTVQEARRYSDHVFNLFRPYIGKQVLEVGCGIGTMTARLLDAAERVVALEPNPHCASRTREVLGTHPRLTLHEATIEACDRDHLQAQRFDTVYCSNVLEHIEDDVAALRTFRDMVVPGGNVLIFVPAIPAAYGPLDAELGHFRRYTKATLRLAFADAGLELRVLRYTNPIGLAGWMFNAHVTKSRIHSPAQMRLFDALVAPWALPLEKAINPPIGLSLVAVGSR